MPQAAAAVPAVIVALAAARDAGRRESIAATLDRTAYSVPPADGAFAAAFRVAEDAAMREAIEEVRCAVET